MNNQNQKILFFDGVCGLCDHFVTFMLNADKNNILLFSPQQGLTFQKITETTTSFLNNGPTIVYYRNGKLITKSNAVLAALTDLGGPYKFVLAFKIIPISWRDFIYDFVAKNRYRVFGQHETCRLPTSLEQKRFLP